MAMMQTVALLALMSTHAGAATIDGGDAAKELSSRHEKLVLPMLEEEHLDSTSAATKLLEKLATKSAAVKSAKQNTDSPDTTLDDCRVLENTTLHEWKVCNKTREETTVQKAANCTAQADASPGSYTIDQSKAFDMSYKKEGSSTPMATCNFETFKLEGTDADCKAFVADILGEAKDEFDADYTVYTAAAKACQDMTDALEKKVKECLAAEEAYTKQEEQCTKDETGWQLSVCKFQAALKSKCVALTSFNSALDALLEEEKTINAEIRAVSYSKCLLDSYSNETCFKTTVTDHCTSQVNGASEEYATAAAEEINKFRESSKTHLQEYTCEATSFTIGTNDLSYEKLDPADDYSYYTKKGQKTFSASAEGELSPPPSAAC